MRQLQSRPESFNRPLLRYDIDSIRNDTLSLDNEVNIQLKRLARTPIIAEAEDAQKLLDDWKKGNILKVDDNKNEKAKHMIDFEKLVAHVLENAETYTEQRFFQQASYQIKKQQKQQKIYTGWPKGIKLPEFKNDHLQEVISNFSQLNLEEKKKIIIHYEKSILPIYKINRDSLKKRTSILINRKKEQEQKQQEQNQEQLIKRKVKRYLRDFGLEESISEKDLTTFYKKKAREWHPDRAKQPNLKKQYEEKFNFLKEGVDYIGQHKFKKNVPISTGIVIYDDKFNKNLQQIRRNARTYQKSLTRNVELQSNIELRKIEDKIKVLEMLLEYFNENFNDNYSIIYKGVLSIIGIFGALRGVFNIEGKSNRKLSDIPYQTQFKIPAQSFARFSKNLEKVPFIKKLQNGVTMEVIQNKNLQEIPTASIIKLQFQLKRTLDYFEKIKRKTSEQEKTSEQDKIETNNMLKQLQKDLKVVAKLKEGYYTDYIPEEYKFGLIEGKSTKQMITELLTPIEKFINNSRHKEKENKKLKLEIIKQIEYLQIRYATEGSFKEKVEKLKACIGEFKDIYTKYQEHPYGVTNLRFVNDLDKKRMDIRKLSSELGFHTQTQVRSYNRKPTMIFDTVQTDTKYKNYLKEVSILDKEVKQATKYYNDIENQEKEAYYRHYIVAIIALVGIYFIKSFYEKMSGYKNIKSNRRQIFRKSTLKTANENTHYVLKELGIPHKVATVFQVIFMMVILSTLVSCQLGEAGTYYLLNQIYTIVSPFFTVLITAIGVSGALKIATKTVIPNVSI